MGKEIINTISPPMSENELLSGLFLDASGYLANVRFGRQNLHVTGEMRLYYAASGSGAVAFAGKEHIFQQHDVLFLPGGFPLSLTVSPDVPANLWWIDIYGPSVKKLMKKMGITPSSPAIRGMYDPRFFQELKAVVMHADSSSSADRMHVIGGVYKLFGLLLDAARNSFWITVPHDDAAILYTGEWKPWPSPFADTHEEYYTAMPRAYAEYNFMGAGIKWYGTVNFDCGKADVIIDGEYMGTIDTYNPTRLSKQLLYSNSRLLYGKHIIKIFCTGEKNDKATNCDVVVESFQYLASPKSYEVRESTEVAASLIVRKAIDHMRANLRGVNIDQTARAIGVSRSYFSSQFAAEMGLSPSRYLIRMRIDAAKKMLAETAWPINKIAAEIGYADVFYFSRIFKERENVSPSQYRKLHAKQASRT
ncbi:MAG: HTH-type transcriptional activator RhaR [Desulfovibrio sp.]